MILALERKLRYLLRQRWDDAGVDAPVFPFDDYPTIARRLFREVQRPRFGDPRVIALELSLVVICCHVEGCYGEVYEGGTILYSCKGGEPYWGLRIYHALAHWVFETWYGNEYSEADAWLLTIELACCGEYLLQVGHEQLAQEQRYAPAWLHRLYCEELGELAVSAATRWRWG